MFIATLLVVAKNRGKPASHCRENGSSMARVLTYPGLLAHCACAVLAGTGSHAYGSGL